jgi:hypothetical protein
VIFYRDFLSLFRAFITIKQMALLGHVYMDFVLYHPGMTVTGRSSFLGLVDQWKKSGNLPL